MAIKCNWTKKGKEEQRKKRGMKKKSVVPIYFCLVGSIKMQEVIYGRQR